MNFTHWTVTKENLRAKNDEIVCAHSWEEVQKKEILFGIEEHSGFNLEKVRFKIMANFVNLIVK